MLTSFCEGNPRYPAVFGNGEKIVRETRYGKGGVVEIEFLLFRIL